ncbi:MAG: 3-dehydroquinate synthase, partial [Acetatifactor sp.]|nr:3-dehydroquinate synthase [Acetatifactor sp.]
MSVFNVELKKIIDESYEIEIGFCLEDQLILDIQTGLVGSVTKFAVITDSVVKDLYAVSILNKLINAGYHADLFVFDAGEVNKTRKTKELIEDAMLEKGYRRDCC